MDRYVHGVGTHNRRSERPKDRHRQLLRDAKTLAVALALLVVIILISNVAFGG